jgi:hypothetical protein
METTGSQAIVSFPFVAVLAVGLAVLSVLGLERPAGRVARQVNAEAAGKVSSSLGRDQRGDGPPRRPVRAPLLPFGGGLTAPHLPAS